MAGITHPLAWVLGLSLWATNLDVRASGATVVAAYSPAGGRAAVQATLVHGLAGIAYGLVAVGLSRLARSVGALRGSRIILVAGLGAAVVSLAQWALDLTLALSIGPSGDSVTAGSVMTAINRLDGVKMLLFAVVAAVTARCAPEGVISRWETMLGYALAVTSVGAGIGYLFLIPALASLAFVAGPLLLLWVPTAAIRCWRAARLVAPGATA